MEGGGKGGGGGREREYDYVIIYIDYILFCFRLNFLLYRFFGVIIN